MLGPFDVVEAQSDLSFDERVPLRFLLARGQLVGAHTEPAAQFAKELERRNSLSALDARDVGGAAAGERELPLAQAAPLPSLPEADAHRRRTIHVG
jgi:hypothetical protein